MKKLVLWIFVILVLCTTVNAYKIKSIVTALPYNFDYITWQMGVGDINWTGFNTSAVNITESDPIFSANRSSIWDAINANNLTALHTNGGTSTGGTYDLRNSVIQFKSELGRSNHTLNNMATHWDELTTYTLLDASRSRLTVGGSRLNFTLYTMSGQPFAWNFNSTIYPSAKYNISQVTIALLNGTNSTPKINYIHWMLVANVPTLTTTETYPSYAHIDVGTFVVGEVKGSSANIYSYSRNRYELDSFVGRVIERFENTGTLYVSGFTPNATTTWLRIADGGEYFNGLFEMTSTNKVNVSRGFYYINGTGHFVQANSLATFTKYANGAAMTGVNLRVNIVWGVVAINTTGEVGPTQVKLVAVLPNQPTAAYNTVADAIADIYDTTNYFPPNNELKKTFVPVARTILRPNTDVFEPFYSGIYYQDVRGKITAGGAASPTVDTSQFLTKDGSTPLTGSWTTGLFNIVSTGNITAHNFYGNWNGSSLIRDYNNYTKAIIFSGTGTKTLTLGRNGMSNLTASFVDNNTYVTAFTLQKLPGGEQSIGLTQKLPSPSFSITLPNYVNLTTNNATIRFMIANSTYINATILKLTFQSSAWNASIANSINNDASVRLSLTKYNQTTIVKNVNASKLNKTDQRYNDTSKINALNVTTVNSDNTITSKLNVINESTYRLVDSSYYLELETDVVYATTNGFLPFLGTAVSSGTVTQLATNASHPGIALLKDSTTANGGYCAGTNTNQYFINGTERGTFIFKRQGSRTTEIYMFGFTDKADVNLPINGCFFRFNSTHGHLWAACRANNAQTKATTNYSIATATWYRLEMNISSTATSASFYIYDDVGTLLWSEYVGSNVPRSGTRVTGFATCAFETTTDAAGNLLLLDYMRLKVPKRLTR